MNWSRQPYRAFTLLELSFVLVIIGILTMLLSAAIQPAKGLARSIQCRNNAQQLTKGWLLYSLDHDGRLLPNTAGALSYHESWLPGNVQLTLTDHTVRRGLLYPYVPTLDSYRCPSDLGRVEILGRSTRRAVSYGLNIYLGGSLTTASTEEWLGHPAATRDTELNQPSGTLVFICEDPEGHAGTQFVYYPVSRKKWITFPSDRHQQGSSLSFADGHVERWRWRWPKAGRWRMGMPLSVANDQDLRDLRRLQATIPD